MSSSNFRASAQFLKDRLGSFLPKVAVVLGSGLGGFAKNVSKPQVFSYGDIPYFPQTGVLGHEGKLTFGYIGSTPVAVMQGRIHGYEGRGSTVQAHPLRTLRVLGAETAVLTCAAGSLRTDLGPGRLMMITDHINMMGTNPLVGLNDDQLGPRFPGMADAWDPHLQQLFRQAALEAKVDLAAGIYAAVMGPAFETPAEVRMLRTLGADAVGMSTVPDCLIARHCGMTVAGCAVITNLGVGLSNGEVSHEQTLKSTAAASGDFEKVMRTFVEKLS